jgi:hypothetical protein
MLESARTARLMDYFQLIGFAGFRRNSQGEVTPSCGCEHVGKGEVFLVAVPWSWIGDEGSCFGELAHEPKDDKTVGPVRKHRGTNDRVLLTTLWFSRTKELLGLPVGHFNAPAGSIPHNNVRGRSRYVRVEEHDIRVFAIRVSTQDDADRLLSCTMIPQSCEMMDHPSDLFSITEDLDLRPPHGGVLKHGCRSGQPITLFPRSASPSRELRLDKTEQSRRPEQPSRYVDPCGTSFEHRFAAVTKIGDDSEAFTFSEPRMGQSDKIQTQLRLGSVGQPFGLDLGFRWPPKARSIRQTKHSIADSGKANGQTDDDETDPIALLLRLLGLLWGRTVMLPAGSADLFAPVLVQRIVNHHEDLESLGNQRFDDDSEQTVRYPVRLPLPLSQEPVDRGEVPGLMEPHGQNNPADGVSAHREHPADHQHHEDPVTRSAETVLETNLVNPERIWYLPFHLGVPPSGSSFPKTGLRGTPPFFKYYPTARPSNNAKRAKLQVMIDLLLCNGVSLLGNSPGADVRGHTILIIRPLAL